MIEVDGMSPEAVPTRTHSLVPGRRPVSVGRRDEADVSLMVHGPFGDEDTSASQDAGGPAVGQARVTVQPRPGAGHDHDDISDVAAAEDGAPAAGAAGPPVVTLGSARLHTEKK